MICKACCAGLCLACTDASTPWSLAGPHIFTISPPNQASRWTISVILYLSRKLCLCVLLLHLVLVAVWRGSLHAVGLLHDNFPSGRFSSCLAFFTFLIFPLTLFYEQQFFFSPIPAYYVLSLVQLSFIFCPLGVSQTDEGRIWENSIRQLTAHRMLYTNLELSLAVMVALLSLHILFFVSTSLALWGTILCCLSGIYCSICTYNSDIRLMWWQHLDHREGWYSHQGWTLLIIVWHLRP